MLAGANLSFLVARVIFLSHKVTLNVYDLSPVNEFGHPIGLGVFHSGLEVDGREYTFAGGGGIFDHDPRKGELAASEQ